MTITFPVIGLSSCRTRQMKAESSLGGELGGSTSPAKVVAILCAMRNHTWGVRQFCQGLLKLGFPAASGRSMEVSWDFGPGYSYASVTLGTNGCVPSVGF